MEKLQQWGQASTLDTKISADFTSLPYYLEAEVLYGILFTNQKKEGGV